MCLGRCGGIRGAHTEGGPGPPQGAGCAHSSTGAGLPSSALPATKGLRETPRTQAPAARRARSSHPGRSCPHAPRSPNTWHRGACPPAPCCRPILLVLRSQQDSHGVHSAVIQAATRDEGGTGRKVRRGGKSVGEASPSGRQGANVFTIPAIPSSPCSETKRSEGDVNSLPLAPTHAAGS